MSMSNTEKTVKDIRRNTRRKFSTEEKIRIVLDGLRGESSIAELCRRRASTPTCITAGARTFWKLGRSACRAIPLAKPIPMKCPDLSARMAI